ncbi:hypothetical protein KSP39_PZI015423 [Platanthera zijinensis]|uniref:Reverse transcriptase Ty1/copia-type domain-containing protein n=1 Tax=Platanthera zijinensis TaxID=2320716 RepID=A0AAP0G237_9ASPA
MNVKTAFLNGDLTEEIYMSQPEGFIVEGHENKVCKLIKSLYGLKQAPKLWHEKFDYSVKNMGFMSSLSDKCLYIRHRSNKVAIICLYVDDMLILGSDQSVVDDVKSELMKEFSIKDLGAAEPILGMQVSFGKNGISLSQSHYIKSMLDTWGYSERRAVETPYDYNNRLKPNNGAAIRQSDYAKLISSLMYAMVCTRPDIAFTVGMLSRFTSNPSQDHWDALDRLIRYLKHTQKYALCYHGHPLVLEGYSDAS